MKTVTLNESQLFRLLENEVANFNGGDIKEFPGSVVSTTANVTNTDGEETYGEPTDTDKVSNDMTAQQLGARFGRRGAYGV